MVRTANKIRKNMKNKSALTDFGSNVEIDNDWATTVDPDGASSLDKNTQYDFKQFTDLGSGIFTMCGRTMKTLISGVYSINIPQNGIPMYINKDIKSDTWINFHDDLINEILAEIDAFWQSGEKFKKYGVLQRRGYLLYGPAGTGKTILIKQIMAKIIKDNGIVFLCNGSPSSLVRGIEFYRKIEPQRKIVVVMEDIDTIIKSYGEDAILQYLDGEDSNDCILNIASTNYPEKLDRRLVQRPRRFDKIIKIGYPDDKMRSSYFSEKLGITDDELQMWVDGTKNFSFAALSEMVISVKCLDVEFEKAKEALSSMMKTIPDSKEYEQDYNDKKPFLGFGN